MGDDNPAGRGLKKGTKELTDGIKEGKKVEKEKEDSSVNCLASEAMLYAEIFSKATKSKVMLQRVKAEIVATEEKKNILFSCNISHILQYAKKRDGVAGVLISDGSESEERNEYLKKLLDDISNEVINWVEDRKFKGLTELDIELDGKANKDEKERSLSIVQGFSSNMVIESLFCHLSAGLNEENKIWINPATGPPFNTSQAELLYSDSVEKEAISMPLMNYLMNEENSNIMQQSLFSPLPYTVCDEGEANKTICPLFREDEKITTKPQLYYRRIIIYMPNV